MQIHKFYLHYKPELHLLVEAECVGGKHARKTDRCNEKKNSLDARERTQADTFWILLPSAVTYYVKLRVKM